jgi:hypothetical protein
MHQDRTDHYIGAENENIALNASTPNSGTLNTGFNNQVVNLPVTVQFSPTAGEERDLVATLVGPPGSHCAISIDNVDGGKDVVSLLVGVGSFSDTVVLEFATASAATNTFIEAANSLKGAGQ